MSALAEAKLTDAERRAVARFVDLLRGRLGKSLIAVWLYGSRARGEGGGLDSDIDLMVITRATLDDPFLVAGLAVDAELAERQPVKISPQVWTRDHLVDRREIRSFFVQELDRDKLVVDGEDL